GQCQGDSGGPTFVEIEGAQTVVGVTSFGDQDCAILGADTRVDAEIDWVDQTIGDSLQCVWAGELCLINGEEHACSQTCNVDANDCPDGFDCMAFEDGGACWASPGGGGG